MYEETGFMSECSFFIHLYIEFTTGFLLFTTCSGYFTAPIGVRDGGQLPPPNSGSLSTLIRAESRNYSGKTQYMFEKHEFRVCFCSSGTHFCYYPPPALNMDRIPKRKDQRRFVSLPKLAKTGSNPGPSDRQSCAPFTELPRPT